LFTPVCVFVPANVDTLAAENEQLRNAVDTIKSHYEEVIAGLKTELRLKSLKLQKALQELYGSSSEKLPLDDKQLSLLVDCLGDRPVAAQEVIEEIHAPGQPKTKRASRQPLPEDIETIEVRIEPEEKVCPHCCKEKREMGCEVTEELDFIPAKLIKRRIVRTKLACSCGQGKVVIAPLPPRLIEKGRPGAGLLAQVVLSKYVDHLPLYRQQQMFARLNVNLARQTLSDWTEQAAFWLEAIYKGMREELLDGDYLQVDETPVRLMDPEIKGKTATGWLWVAARPGGDVLFRFDPQRNKAAAKELVGNFTGYLQRDGYGVYQSLVKDHAGLKPVGCWAHARRKFFEAVADHREEALWFLEKIRELYRLEKKARDECLSPADRMKLRKEQASPVLDAICQRLKTVHEGRALLPKSLLGQAVNYALNEWPVLTTYLENGTLEIDNNLCENSIRPTAIGKKNWLFLGHPDAAWKSAVIYSIVVSCQRRKINPWAYLKDVFTRIPAMKTSEVSQLLPANWKPAV